MKFTDKQFKVLSQYEDRFSTAVNADWARNPGSIILRTIHEIWKQATGIDEQMRFSCSHCILRLLKEVGTAYFADKKEREEIQAKAEAKRQAQEKKKKQAQEESNGEGGTTESPQSKKGAKGEKKGSAKK